MKKEDKLIELEATIDHYESILIKWVKDKGSLACKESGFEDVCNTIRSLNSTLKHINEIEDEKIVAEKVSNETSATLGTSGVTGSHDEYCIDCFGRKEKSEIDIDELSKNLNSTYKVREALCEKIYAIGSSYKAIKIISNGNMIDVLRDTVGNTVNPVTYSQQQTTPFPVGTIGNLTLYVDPLMKWGDNRILFYGVDDNLIHTLNVIDNNAILI